jgi:hypothetical protein
LWQAEMYLIIARSVQPLGSSHLHLI